MEAYPNRARPVKKIVLHRYCPLPTAYCPLLYRAAHEAGFDAGDWPRRLGD